jgi:hypothetical protein
MSLEYQQDDLNRRITVTAPEPVTSEDLVELASRQAAGGAWSYGMLYDATAGHKPPSRDTIHRLVLQAGVLTTKHGRRGPIALVVRDPDLERTGQRYATLGELAALNARTFTTIREAEDWLRQEW